MGLTLTSIVPADPHRGYSFTDHSTLQPTTPQPGDRLDSEFDAIYAILADIAASLNVITARPQITLADLAPGVQTQLTQAAVQGVQTLLSQIQSAAANTLAQADRANAEATRAQGAANQAANAATELDGVSDELHQALADVGAWSTETEREATDAQNAANDAEDAANRARKDQELAGAWAEYMEGGNPIPPRFLADYAITGDHWSARWWAAQAAGAFGALSSLYMGALPGPPTTTPTGQPLPVGAIYYNTTSKQPFVWDGTQWLPFYAPTKALMLTLLYRATANQTQFNLNTADLNGQSYHINATVPEPIDVYINGARSPRNAPVPGNGDWDLNPATGIVTFTSPIYAGSLVQIDVLAPASAIAPSRVQTQALAPFTPIDGTTQTFALKLASNGSAVTPSSPVEIFASVDGVVQQPGQDYNVTGSNLTFGEAPQAGARVWALWYGPNTGTTL